MSIIWTGRAIGCLGDGGGWDGRVEACADGLRTVGCSELDDCDWLRAAFAGIGVERVPAQVRLYVSGMQHCPHGARHSSACVSDELLLGTINGTYTCVNPSGGALTCGQYLHDVGVIGEERTYEQFGGVCPDAGCGVIGTLLGVMTINALADVYFSVDAEGELVVTVLAAAGAVGAAFSGWIAASAQIRTLADLTAIQFSAQPGEPTGCDECGFPLGPPWWGGTAMVELL